MTNAGQPEATPAPAKAQLTQTRILETALALFRERGFEATTMRAIAERAGVSLGNAYYYYGSKDHLVQAFYGRVHEEHLALCDARLGSMRSLKERLRFTMRSRLELIEPYHGFAAVLFRSAADPQSPLNPFSAESRPVREQATALLARVIAGSNAHMPEDLGAALPNLLWVYQMGLVLFWIHDTSQGRRRTMQLVDGSVDLVVKLIGLASLPFMRPVRRMVLRLVENVER